MSDSATQVVDVVSEHIVKTPGTVGGRARIAGTRIRVMDVVGWRKQGMSAEEIVRDWDWITLADVYAALAYYEDNKAEIEQAYTDDEAFAEQFLKDHPDVKVITLND